MRKVKTKAHLLVLLISIYEARPLASITNLQKVSLPSEIWRQKFDSKFENEPRLKGFANALWNHTFGIRLWENLDIPNASIRADQVCDIPFPDLPIAKPLHDPNTFTWARSLLDQASKIISEFQQLDRENSPWQASIATKLCNDTLGFTKLVLSHDGGHTFTKVAMEHFNQTCSILQTTVGSELCPRPIGINAQGPLSGLAPHSDNHNFVYSCHLGLDVPKDGACRFIIHDPITLYIIQEAHWHTCQLLVADTSFVHSTQNQSPTNSRYTLCFHIWHPFLTTKERQGILDIHQFANEILAASTSSS